MEEADPQKGDEEEQGYQTRIGAAGAHAALAAPLVESGCGGEMSLTDGLSQRSHAHFPQRILSSAGRRLDPQRLPGWQRWESEQRYIVTTPVSTSWYFQKPPRESTCQEQDAQRGAE